MLAAGDSVTDVTFVGDATAVHLVINRNKSELMCRAYDNADGKWLINPMFIAPNKPHADPYPCSTTAFTKIRRHSAPLRRERRQPGTGPEGHRQLKCTHLSMANRLTVLTPA